MKRLVLLIVLIAGFRPAKAQQFIPVKPNLALTDSLNFFKPQAYPSLKSFLLQPSKVTNAAIVNNINTRIVYSRMPVAGMSSQINQDHMPVAGLGSPGNQDNMPVLKIEVIDPLAKDKQPTP